MKLNVAIVAAWIIGSVAGYGVGASLATSQQGPTLVYGGVAVVAVYVAYKLAKLQEKVKA